MMMVLVIKREKSCKLIFFKSGQDFVVSDVGNVRCRFSLLTEPPSVEGNLTLDQRRVQSRNHGVWRENVGYGARKCSFLATCVGLFRF